MTRLHLILLLSYIVGLSGCSSLIASAPTPTALPSTSTATVPATPTTPPTLIPTATPLTCLGQPGEVQSGSLDSTKPPQQFLIYLPPCYAEQSDRRYPVLYLLHGQTYTDDQWVRIGAATVADDLIHSGYAAPFIIVFPDDRYWNVAAGSGFGVRLVNFLIPFVDANYRTLSDAPHRALGGLSRGGGWAIHMALTRYDLFGIVGLHSPVIFEDDGAVLERLIRSLPSNSWPRLWLDGGDRDGELGNILRLENLLNAYEVPHEWRLYTGDHTEKYWHAHLNDYFRWYAEQFDLAGPATQAATPAPAATQSP